jgi:hypothetical protein
MGEPSSKTAHKGSGGRGLRAAWWWRRAYWLRVAPGISGGAVVVLLPLLFFLPLEAVPVFGERFRGIAILIWASSLFLALSIRGGESLRHEASVWPYQKGFSLGEMALEDWYLDLGLLGMASMWWASLGVLALSQGPSSFPPGRWLPFFVLGFTTAALTHSLTLCLSALGIRRPSDVTVLLAVLSLVAPVLTLRAPEWVLRLARLMLPPFRASIELHGALRGKEVEEVLGSLLHLLVFSGVVLWTGLRRISAWRPRG